MAALEPPDDLRSSPKNSPRSSPRGNRRRAMSMDGRKSPHSKAKEDISLMYGAFFQESTVMAEYCLVLENPIPGVYILPSSISPLIWYGLIYISSGLYQESIFKFTLSIPTNYPDSGSPRIDFQSGVYHPQVNADTGELETKKQFKRWRRDINFLRDLLAYTKSIFYTIECDSPLNESAADAYVNDMESFKENVRVSREECKLTITEQPDESDPHSILISTWNHDIMKCAREQIFEPQIETVDQLSEDTGLPLGLSWVKDGKPFEKNII